MPDLSLKLICAAGLALAIWVGLRRVRAKLNRDPSCGACGYAVRGLPSFQCPECGSDLRDVGIITPRIRGPISPLLLVFLWSIFVVITGVILSFSLGSALFPTIQTNITVRYLELPQSRRYTHARIVSIIRSESWAATPLRRVRPIEREKSVDVCIFRNDGTEQVLPVTPNVSLQSILSWMSDIGVSGDDAASRGEAQDIRNVVAAVASGKMFSVTSSRHGRTSTEAWTTHHLAGGFLSVSITFWSFIWLMGALILIRPSKASCSIERRSGSGP